MSKFAIVSFAVVLLGSSAAIAQPYGYRPYGPPIGANGPTPGYCGPHTAGMTNWILDPATGQPITQSQYLSRYPSNPPSWSYDCNTGLWTDPSAQAYATQGQYYGGDRGRGREEGRDRERDRGDQDRDNRDRDNRDRDDRDRGDYR